MPTPLPVLTPRFAVGDLVKWGYLVKMWSTQQAYPGVPVMPIPRTLPEFKAQCAAISLTVTIPEYMTGVSFFVHSPECLFVRIPPREMVLNTEAFLQDDRTSYPKLQIYSLISYEPIEIKPENKLSFHAARIGDYSLAFCH